MKKLSFYTILCCLAVVCTFSLNSCQEFNIDSQAEFPPLLETDAQSEYAVLAKSPNTIIFNISSNTPWKIESNKNWCVPTPAMSSASSLIAEVSVIMEENPDEQERTAILTITADRIKESKTVTITQAAKGTLLVQGFDDPFPSEGGEATFTITSNKAWKVTSSNQWLTLDKEEGEGNGEKVTITATAKPNTGLKRTATLTIVSEGYETEITATQNGIMLEFAETTDVTFDGGQDKETKTYQVLANVDWQVSSDATWLKVEKSIDGNITATSQSEIYFTTRKAVISLTPTDKTLGTEATTLEVRQAGGSYELNGTPGTIDEATGAITFTEETGNANCRYYINKPRKLAIHKWHFSNIEVDDNRCLNMNCVASPIPGWNFWLGVGANPWTFKYRGGSSNDDYKCTPFDLNKLKALKVSHTYSTPDNKTKAKIEVFIKLEGETDWTQIITTPEYENLFETTGSAGNFPYFGFIAGTAGKKGTMTITSYEVTNIE